MKTHLHPTLALLTAAVLFLAGCECSPPPPRKIETSIEVTSGDTVRITIDGQEVIAKLAGIEAPQLEEPYGKEAKRMLDRIIKSAPIDSTHWAKGKNPGESLVWIQLKNGADPSLEMVRAGAAWVCESRRPHLFPYHEALLLQKEAQSRQVGLWALPEYQAKKKEPNAATHVLAFMEGPIKLVIGFPFFVIGAAFFVWGSKPILGSFLISIGMALLGLPYDCP